MDARLIPCGAVARSRTTRAAFTNQSPERERRVPRSATRTIHERHRSRHSTRSIACASPSFQIDSLMLAYIFGRPRQTVFVPKVPRAPVMSPNPRALLDESDVA